MSKYGNLLIGYDFSNGTDKSVLIVGTQEKDKPVTIINAFQGAEAEAMYELLVTKNPRAKTDNFEVKV